MKIRVSYTMDEELREVLFLLSPLPIKVKIAKSDTQKAFKHAYITCRNLVKPDNNAICIDNTPDV